jgi:hypothetical protein
MKNASNTHASRQTINIKKQKKQKKQTNIKQKQHKVMIMEGLTIGK